MLQELKNLKSVQNTHEICRKKQHIIFIVTKKLEMYEKMEHHCNGYIIFFSSVISYVRIHYCYEIPESHTRDFF